MCCGTGMCKGRDVPQRPSKPPFLPAMGLARVAQRSSEAMTCAMVKGAAPRHCLARAGLGSPPAVPLLLGDLQSWSRGSCWPTMGQAMARGTGRWGWWGTCLPRPMALGLFAVLEGAVPHGCWGLAPAVM